MGQRQRDAFRGWMKFLNPQTLKSNLIAASLYLAAWETFRSSVIEQLRGFYLVGIDERGETFAPGYARTVLSRHKSPLQASLLWLQEMGALDEVDMQLVHRLREHRNDIAHHLPEFIGDGSRDVNAELMTSICDLVAKIDRWWIREVEIPTNPDFDDQNADLIADVEITSGNMLFLSLLRQIAMGDEIEATKFYESFEAILPSMEEDSNGAADDTAHRMVRPLSATSPRATDGQT